MKKIYLFGSSGNVGRAIASQLLSRKIVSPDQLCLFASPASTGKILEIQEQAFTLNNPENCSFAEKPLCLFATDSTISKKHIPKALENGCQVIDSSSAFRMQEDVPLVLVPVNGTLLDRNDKHLFACANCIAVPIALVAAPLEKTFGIQRLTAVTYQSTSGAGKEPMDELKAETDALIRSTSFQRVHFQRQIAFNVIPQIDKIRDDGFTGEEHKIIQEVQKIVGSSFPVSATSVRVPVLIGHSVALTLELQKPFELESVIKELQNAPFVSLSSNHFATPAEIVGTDQVHVGRIRRDPTSANGLHLWLCSDNLRRGASTDAVEVAERLLSK